jgi:uncharacterized protein
MFTEFIIKIASRCNLNCTYCYEYNTGYNAWKSQPVVMEDETIKEIVEKVSSYISKKNLNRVFISFHGGEPLLMGKQKFKDIMTRFLKFESLDCEYNYSIQTNGILLDDEWIGIFEAYSVFIGISLDGEKENNDKHRVFRNLSSSYQSVIDSIGKLKASNSRIFNGILAVVDPLSDAKKILSHLVQFHKNLDFLLPHFNYDTIPKEYFNKGIFAEYFLNLFDAWIELQDARIQIRFLESIIHKMLGANSLYEVMNSSPPSLITISTNGDIEGVDTLKSNGTETNKTNYNIHSVDLDDAALLQKYYQISKPPLSEICQECTLVTVCNGGYIPHRYSRENGFNNPSVYCEDLKQIINGIESRIKKAKHVV